MSTKSTNKRNPDEEKIIDSVSTRAVTMKEFTNALFRTFSPNDMSPTSKTAVITETKMRDGTKQQTVTFGKPLDV